MGDRVAQFSYTSGIEENQQVGALAVLEDESQQVEVLIFRNNTCGGWKLDSETLAHVCVFPNKPV